MKEYDKQIGSWLKAKRNAKGYSLQQIADKLDKSRTIVFYWESGKRTIDASDFIDYCKLLNANPVEIMNELFNEK